MVQAKAGVAEYSVNLKQAFDRRFWVRADRMDH